MTSLLEVTAGLPERRFESGAVLIEEGQLARELMILVDGRLEVRKGAVKISTISDAGACIGEVGLLSGSHSSATVIATTPALVRVAADGRAYLRDEPGVLSEVATMLAARLSLLTTYLADLRRQYEGSPGLEMVADVLGELASRPPKQTRPGSARDPDPQS